MRLRGDPFRRFKGGDGNPGWFSFDMGSNVLG